VTVVDSDEADDLIRRVDEIAAEAFGLPNKHAWAVIALRVAMLRYNVKDSRILERSVWVEVQKLRAEQELTAPKKGNRPGRAAKPDNHRDTHK
jgi:hypothetical protein